MWTGCFAGVDAEVGVGLMGVAAALDVTLAGVAGVIGVMEEVAVVGAVSAVPGLVVAAALLIFSAVVVPEVLTPVEEDLPAAVDAGGGAFTLALVASGLAMAVPASKVLFAVFPVDPVAPGCRSASSFADLASTAGSDEIGLVPTESVFVSE